MEHMDLFKSIFARIKDVDSQRLIEEEKLRARAKEHNGHITRLLADVSSSIKRLDLLQGQLLELNEA